MKMKLIVIFTVLAVILGESAWATLEDQSKGPSHSSISSPTSTPKSTTSNTTKTSTTETTKATTTAKTTTKSTSKTSTKATTTAKATTTKATTTAKATTKSTSKTSTKATTTAKATTTKATTTAKATTTKATTTAKATTTKATTTAKATTKSTSKTPTKESTTTTKATTKSTSKIPTTMTTPTKPTEHPTPTSPPSYGKFSLKENNNFYCILAEFAAIFTITYVEKGGSSSTAPTKATTTAIPTTKSTSKTPTKATTTAKTSTKSTGKTPTKATTTAEPTTKSTGKTPTKATTTAEPPTKSTGKTPTKATTTAKPTTKSTIKTKHEVHLNSSSHVNITGNCGTNTTNGNLRISWPKNKPFYTLEFQMSSSSHGWSVISIVFSVTVEGNPAFENITDVGKHVISVYNGSAVPYGQLGGDYFCKNAPSITFKNNETHFEVKSAFTDMRIEPFVHKTKADAFDQDGTVECQSDHTTSPPTTSKPSDNVVPIAVGCALAGLVLIVLIAYVIGRRKSPSGYEKV